MYIMYVINHVDLEDKMYTIIFKNQVLKNLVNANFIYIL